MSTSEALNQHRASTALATPITGNQVSAMLYMLVNRDRERGRETAIQAHIYIYVYYIYTYREREREREERGLSPSTSKGKRSEVRCRIGSTAEFTSKAAHSGGSCSLCPGVEVRGSALSDLG